MRMRTKRGPKLQSWRPSGVNLTPDLRRIIEAAASDIEAENERQAFLKDAQDLLRGLQAPAIGDVRRALAYAERRRRLRRGAE
jgi:hypothetical protein